MNFIKSLIQETNAHRNNELLQKIRNNAEKKYTRQFCKLVTEIDFLIDEKIDLTRSATPLNSVNDQLLSVIIKLNDLFAKCKKECAKHAPPNAREQFDDLETNNKYSYAQICKSVKIIEACIKFNYLFSMFETRLNRLYSKLKLSKTRASRSRYSSKSKHSKSKTLRESPKSKSTTIGFAEEYSKSDSTDTLDEFVGLYKEFVLFTKDRKI